MANNAYLSEKIEMTTKKPEGPTGLTVTVANGLFALLHRHG